MQDFMSRESASESLSPWWRRSALIVIVAGLATLIALTAGVQKHGPPIPERIVNPSGATFITGNDILDGQEVFLKHGLMENGTIWGHGAYLGPDFPALYLHDLALDARESLALEKHGIPYAALNGASQNDIDARVRLLLKTNRYEAGNRTLTFASPEVDSFVKQTASWREYFTSPAKNAGLPAKTIADAEEIRKLTAFFAWTAWASTAPRPGKDYSYTNNFPYEPLAGNTLSSASILWSGLSLIALLGGLAVVLFAFGKFNYLGWKNAQPHVHPELLPGAASPGQRAVLKYFLVVAALFLLQCLAGGALAHYRVDPSGFYGLDLTGIFPSHLLRTWHLQLAVFWVATAYIGGGLLLSGAIGETEPRHQVRGINVLFGAVLVVALGSLLGEAAGLRNLLGDFWFWIGHQGWEYLDLGRLWQILLAAGFMGWLVLLTRAVRPAFHNPEKKEMAALFFVSALAIPLFYLPAMFFTGRTHFSVVDTWRFWIIHLWVEGFFELFVTVMVAVLFHKLGVVKRVTALRVIYLDALLYLGSGVIGTGHHWYWTGQTPVTLALSAVFSAMEVVPLTLLTLDAWDFVKLTRGHCDVCQKSIAIPHKWTFYFLMAVGFWNFVGAGIFGFLINLPVISYFEVGTILTPNHGHAAFMGVFGMLALALTVFALRQNASDAAWSSIEPWVKVSFWGVNTGLLLMVATNLFPAGVLQLADVISNGYWHARSYAFLHQHVMVFLEWLRMPADLIFIGLGAFPLLVAAFIGCRAIPKGKAAEAR